MPESVNVEIALPEEGFDAVIHLCLPASVGQKMRTLRFNSKPWTNFRPENETVTLPIDLKGRNIVDVLYNDSR